MKPLLIAALLLGAISVSAQGVLTDKEIAEAIELGKSGKVPVVQVGTFLGSSQGDFDVFILGPVARIADAAAANFQEYRPFDLSQVTPAMRAVVYVVRLPHAHHSSRPLEPVARFVKHVVLQPKGAKGMDGVIQPVREVLPDAYSDQIPEATFDYLPQSEFDVVVATDLGPQRYRVSGKDRAKIR